MPRAKVGGFGRLVPSLAAYFHKPTEHATMAAEDIKAGRSQVSSKLSEPQNSEQLRQFGRVVAAVAPLVSGSSLVRPAVTEIAQILTGSKL